MSKCYECRYYRIGERRCGYTGYAHSPDDSCGSGEFNTYDVRCCGNCRYYRLETKTCTQSGSGKYPYDRCGIGKHSLA